MAKNQTVFVCSSCGNESAKWLGKCPACNEWNTYYEEKIIKEKSTGNRVLAKAETVKLKEVETEEFIWIIYIGIIFLSFYSNKLEKNYFYRH